MHILVVLVKLCGVLFRGKPGQALLIYIDSERLVARHNHINPQVELVSIDQEWISDIARDY